MISLNKNNFINNSLISFVIRIFSFIISIIYSFLMARILSPSNYSEIAFILVIISFFTSITNFGIGNAIVQDTSLTKTEINKLFTGTIVVSLFFYIFLVISITIYSNLAQNSFNLSFILMICFPFVLNLMNIVPLSILYKELRIRSTLVAGFFISLISSIIGISMAIIGFGTISLVLPMVVSSFIMLVYNLFQTNLSLRLFNLIVLKKIFNYVKFHYPFSIINYFIRNLDSILIGIFYGNLALAYYLKASHLTTLPNDIFSFSITQNLQPSLSKYQNNHAIIQLKYFEFLDFFIPIALFVGSYSLFTSFELATLFFGEQWQITARLFTILSASIFFQLLTMTVGSIYISANKVKLLLRNSLVAFSIFILFYLIGINFELEIFMTFVSAAFIFNFFSVFYLLFKDIFKVKYVYFLIKLYPNILFMLVIVFISIFYNQFYQESAFLNLTIKSFIFLIIFFVYLIFTKKIILFKKILRLFTG